MISVDEARQRILGRCVARPPVEVPVSDALGLVLAEEIVSDIDSPPHNKALVDGYAVRTTDVVGSGQLLKIIEEVTAGEVPTCEVVPGTASRVMTGAPIPSGADAMVMVEQTVQIDDETVSIRQADVKPGNHILSRAASLRRGETILERGTAIRPIEIGLLAETGHTNIFVHPRPRVAVVATGNELVASDQRPEKGQIRNSNGPMLCALVERVGAIAVDLGVGRDQREPLCDLVQRGLECEILVLSGGVSAGVLDLVPSILEEMGVRQIFHKVNLKPGKPIWFGVGPDDQEVNTLVFGLPGNPVSSLVCFELFVRLAITSCGDRTKAGELGHPAQLVNDYIHRDQRPTYFPARLESQDPTEYPRVEPLSWQGSADLCALTGANALIHFPGGEHKFISGDMVEVLPL